MFGSFLRLVQARRAIDRDSLITAAFYAGQAVVCTFLVMFVYARLHLGSAMWAVVSTVLVLQPGLRQSYGASATRFVSNLIGAVTGAVVDKLHGHGPADVMVALVRGVGFCELLRLDQGLRSACASVAIVMMSVNGAVVRYATERRVLAVVIGCSAALVVRILTHRIQEALAKLEHGAAPAGLDEG
jgi:uncharacterized membrane protein YgaE (UPF0421/DUF939 family)